MTHSEYRKSLIGAVELRQSCIDSARNAMQSAREATSLSVKAMRMEMARCMYVCAVSALNSINFWSERVAETANY